VLRIFGLEASHFLCSCSPDDFGGCASATTITAIATGGVPGTTALYPALVTSGDFSYQGDTPGSSGGDGADDQVFWSFDFTGDADYPALTGPIPKAQLTLTLNPRTTEISTDTVIVVGLPIATLPDIPSLNLNVPHTLTFDLLARLLLLGPRTSARSPAEAASSRCGTPTTRTSP
jgi:hypothetical protein